MLRTATTLPEPPAPSGPWLELGQIRHLNWPVYSLPIANLPAALQGLRIVHITDAHIDRTWMPAWDELHRRLADNPPDLILSTGDFVERKDDHRHALPLLQRFLEGLRARLGVWAILGNHDTELLALRMINANLRLLCNERVMIPVGDAAIELVGIHGVDPDDLSPAYLSNLGDKPANAIRIAMAHYPSQAVPLERAGADLVLAGHTHGGQVCLPGGIPLVTHDILPRRFARGVHRIGNTWLAVSRGVGFSRYPIRTFCPAEVIEITLVAADAP